MPSLASDEVVDSQLGGIGLQETSIPPSPPFAKTFEGVVMSALSETANWNSPPGCNKVPS